MLYSQNLQKTTPPKYLNQGVRARRANPGIAFGYWLYLRTPELVGLAHQFCASKVSVCSKFTEKNQIVIISMKHAMCNMHINDCYSKYSV